jgi:hypothetical protein
MHMPKVRKIIGMVVFFFWIVFLAPSPLQAQGVQGPPKPVAPNSVPASWGGVCTYNEVATIQGLQCLIGRILQLATSAIGFAGFVMLIVGSFKYLLSGGNSKGAEDAKNTMTFAIVGLVVALSAFFVLNILADFTGVKSILNFTVPNF